MDLGRGVRNAIAKITGAAVVDEKAVKELAKELQRVLISNDVNVKLVLELTKKIEKRALDEKLLPGLSMREHVVKVVFEELQMILGPKFEPRIEKQRILFLGLFGSGKTTSIGKLAKLYQGKGLKVAVIAGDVHRPAAFQQLKQLSEQVKCGFFGIEGEKSAALIAEKARRELDGKYDVLIFDSAGRSAFDAELADELKKVNKAFGPDEKYLVVSADVGQVAGKQAQEFNSAINGLTGVIVSKMDGSGKGGGALSSVAVSGSRIAFIGTGEKMQDLQPFDPVAFVSELVGFPNLGALMEKAKEATDEKLVENAMIEGKLDYESFLAQMRAMRKMGPLKQIMQMLGAYDLPEDMLVQSEEKMKQFEAAVLSMTPAERTKPELMKSKARQQRIANGAGLDEKDVRELVQNFERVQKMMKQLGKNRGLMKKLKGGVPDLSKLGGLMGGKPKFKMR
ncbi:MAG: signal recognition particle receptor subunit alpha [Candidatus Micrarchaeota archaeon]